MYPLRAVIVEKKLKIKLNAITLQGHKIQTQHLKQIKPHHLPQKHHQIKPHHNQIHLELRLAQEKEDKDLVSDLVQLLGYQEEV